MTQRYAICYTLGFPAIPHIKRACDWWIEKPTLKLVFYRDRISGAGGFAPVDGGSLCTSLFGGDASDVRVLINFIYLVLYKSWCVCDILLGLIFYVHLLSIFHLALH